MSRYRKLTTIAAVAALAFGLAACGSGSDKKTMVDPTPPTTTDLAWDMLAGLTVQPGTYTLSNAPADLLDQATALDVPAGGFEPGASVMLGGLTLTCEGTQNCTVSVGDDDSITTTGIITVTTTVAVTPPVVTPPTQPVPVDVTMDLALEPAERAALLLALPGAGSSDRVDIEAGGSETRSGVVFTCVSAYPCTVTVTNSLNTILASWSSQRLGDGTANVMAGILEPVRTPMVVGGANRANPAAIKAAIDKNENIVTYIGLNAIDTDGKSKTAKADGPVMVKKVEHPGTLELQGPFVELERTGAGGTPLPNPVIKSDATDADGGPTLSAAGLDIDPADLAKWRVHALERDWAHRLPDEPKDAPLYGGFVTNAIVVEDIEEDKTRAFDEMFKLDNGELKNILGNPASNSGNAVFVYDGVAGTDQNKKDAYEDFRGSFAGVRGIYRCTGMDPCWLVRDKKDDSISIAADGKDGKGNSVPDDKNFATVLFIPDNPEAEASVPDWAWLTFGVWLTTPNDDSGLHSIGMIAWPGGLASTPDSTYYKSLTGEAEYRGLAVGYYVDGIGTTAAEAGTFTATASLTADFGAGKDDDTLEGTVSNFHDANGGAMSEFVVDLELADLDGNDGKVKVGAITSGHANGVAWAGNWNAQLSGVPDANVDNLSMMESEVGTLQANIAAAPKAGDYPLGAVGSFDAQNASSGVTGTFGAHLQPKPAN